ncbi:galactose-1-phosphate uridylyltransferase, partial [Alteromonas oceanisediminis]|uniref:galactose-1-phosphate uridylyltransferase n=1 Tax=Alteromonas oceanisediminis TaxID=2836180 RepID=UPI002023AE8C
QRHLPTIAQHKLTNLTDYFQQHGSPLLYDYLQRELGQEQRVVCQNSHWVVIVPYWAAWPFETLVLPKQHISSMADISAEASTRLAAILGDITARYDNLFQTSFPYSMGWASAPVLRHLPSGLKAPIPQSQVDAAWTLHAHFYPPLLRSANVRKFMVGYEMFAESQRDITPEQAAEQLKMQSNVHYLSGAPDNA